MIIKAKKEPQEREEIGAIIAHWKLNFSIDRAC